MDNGFEPQLSYDDSVPYHDQVSSLAERIGSTKVYLLEDASKSKRSKNDDLTNGNRDVASGGDGEDEMDTDKDPSLRSNAILLQGSPIAHLPTVSIFDYAAHFGIHPLGLEWVDDNTCIFVFPSKAEALSAFLALQKPTTASQDETPSPTTARPIPVSLWPNEDRIHHSLGVGQGLKGTIQMRWARIDDKKKRGAKKDSAFYKKHGVDAGKESAGFGVVPASATVAAAAAVDGGSLARRLGPVGDTLEERIATDAEIVVVTEGVREWDLGKPGVEGAVLENRISPGRKRKRGRKDDIGEFLGDDLEEEEEPTEPPSKMRSDYITQPGRPTARLPRRARGQEEEDVASRKRGGRRRGRNRGIEIDEPPRKKTREELDEELEAFLNDRA